MLPLIVATVCIAVCLLSSTVSQKYPNLVRNAPNSHSSQGKLPYVIATPILNTLTMMAESALNLTLP